MFWGLSATAWAAIAALGSMLAAVAALGSVVLTHWLGRPRPAFEVTWMSITGDFEDQTPVVTVTNLGRTACTVYSPFIEVVESQNGNWLTDGVPVAGPNRVSIAPFDSAQWAGMPVVLLNEDEWATLQVNVPVAGRRTWRSEPNRVQLASKYMRRRLGDDAPEVTIPAVPDGEFTAIRPPSRINNLPIPLRPPLRRLQRQPWRLRPWRRRRAARRRWAKADREASRHPKD